MGLVQPGSDVNNPTATPVSGFDFSKLMENPSAMRRYLELLGVEPDEIEMSGAPNAPFKIKAGKRAEIASTTGKTTTGSQQTAASQVATTTGTAQLDNILKTVGALRASGGRGGGSGNTGAGVVPPTPPAPPQVTGTGALDAAQGLVGISKRFGGGDGAAVLASILPLVTGTALVRQGVSSLSQRFKATDQRHAQNKAKKEAEGSGLFGVLGSVGGAVIGAALAPFTFGTSLIATAASVGVGAALGSVAGDVASGNEIDVGGALLSGGVSALTFGAIPANDFGIFTRAALSGTTGSFF